MDVLNRLVDEPNHADRASEMVAVLRRAQYHDKDSISDEGLTKLIDCLRYALDSDGEGKGKDGGGVSLSINQKCT